MKLTLHEAAKRLGKTVRQLRYQIQKGELRAEKVAGRWFVELGELPRSPGQQRAEERKRRRLRSAVEEVLELDGERPKRRYSVRDLRAFQIALPLHADALETLGTAHPAVVSLRDVLGELTRGCHRFERTEKAEAYRRARDAASAAVCELVVEATPAAQRIADAIEQELMAAFAGLLRRVERRRRP